MSPLITLTTDYGDDSPYAAVLKGVILTINPAARVVDLTHRIRPQDLRHASYFLATAVPYFPPDTIHVCVIDPGVGTERAGVLVGTGGHRLVGPDNGIFTGAIRRLGPAAVRKLTEPRFWRHPVSNTFHGRDVFAPVAAHLSCAADPAEMGPLVPGHVELHLPAAVASEGGWAGEVQVVDHYGNLITNIPADGVKALPVKVSVSGRHVHPMPWVRSYGEAAPGELVCLFSSDGYFEVAEVNGNAAERLGVGVGTPVMVEYE